MLTHRRFQDASLASLALVVAIGSRIVATARGVIMIVAAAMVHAPNGSFMNWFGSQAGEGFELHILAAAALAREEVRGQELSE